MSWSTQRASKLNSYGTRNSSISTRRDDLTSQRYIACDPDGVYPLPPLNKSHEKIYPDFVPWHESQQENDLTIENVPRGFLHRPQVPNETASACASMLPLFKQWTSTPALSYFLARSMQSREKMSRLTSGSTFKPPPRVTLTDQKREAWLKDLASPNVPLRRLSRTIPHGIRNKTLLEQCCAKNIPVSRAVWFARCVGANELRGLKRKGNTSTASDSAWIREWTTEVIEFLEKNIILSVQNIDNEDESQLETKLSYLIRLVCSLFMESLMDQTAFLKWVIDFFRNCKLVVFPVSHMLLKLYWKFIVQSTFLSKQLAAALINRYSSLAESGRNNSENVALMTYLKDVGSMIKNLSIVSPMCFVNPDLWQKIDPILSQVIDIENDESMSDMLEELRKRNEALIAVGSLNPAVIKHRRPKAYMIKCLDTIRSPRDLKNVAKILLPLVREDPRRSLTTMFEWTCYKWRINDSNVYISTSLCQIWRTEISDLETSDILVDFLLQIDDIQSILMNRVYGLMIEFLRIDALSVSDYLRKLVSCGVLFLPRLKDRAEVQAKILRSIPEAYTTTSFMRQKDMFLKRSANVEEEKQDITAAKQILSRKIAFLYGDESISDDNGFSEQDLTEQEISILQELRYDTRIELSEDLVIRLERQLNDNFNPLLTHTAYIIRILGLLGDFRALYHSIWMILRGTENMSVIGLLAGVLKEYFIIFGSLGQLDELIDILMEKSNRLAPKFKLTKNIFDLAEMSLEKLDTENQEFKTNVEKLIKLQNSNHIYETAAPSPLSEGLLSDNGPNSPFASLRIYEPTDIRTLPKHFSAVSAQFLIICENIFESKGNYDEIRKFMIGLKLLRDIDSTLFDELYINWLRDQLLKDQTAFKNKHTLSCVVLFSVIYECSTLNIIANMILRQGGELYGRNGYMTLLTIDLEKVEKKLSLNVIEGILFEVNYKMFKEERSDVFMKSIMKGMKDIQGELRNGTEDKAGIEMENKAENGLENQAEIKNENESKALKEEVKTGMGEMNNELSTELSNDSSTTSTDNTNGESVDGSVGTSVGGSVEISAGALAEESVGESAEESNEVNETHELDLNSSTHLPTEDQLQYLLEKSYTDHEMFMDLIIRPVINKSSLSDMILIQKMLISMLKNDEEMIHQNQFSTIINYLSKVCNELNLNVCQSLMEMSVAIYCLEMGSMEEMEKMRLIAEELIGCANGREGERDTDMGGDTGIGEDAGTEEDTSMEGEETNTVEGVETDIAKKEKDTVHGETDKAEETITVERDNDTTPADDIISPQFFGDIIQGFNSNIKQGISIACQNIFLQSPDIPKVLRHERNITSLLSEIICSCGENTNQGIEMKLEECINRLVGSNDVIEIHVDEEMKDMEPNLDIDSSTLSTCIMLIIKIIMMAIHCNDNTMNKTKAKSWLMKLNEKYSEKLENDVKDALKDAINVAKDVYGQENDSWTQNKDYAPSYLSDLMIYNPTSGTYSDINVCSFDLLEDSNPTMSINDVPLDLALFDAITERKNPG